MVDSKHEVKLNLDDSKPFIAINSSKIMKTIIFHVIYFCVLWNFYSKRDVCYSQKNNMQKYINNKRLKIVTYNPFTVGRWELYCVEDSTNIENLLVFIII